MAILPCGRRRRSSRWPARTLTCGSQRLIPIGPAASEVGRPVRWVDARRGSYVGASSANRSSSDLT